VGGGGGGCSADARALCSALTAPRGGSMLREGTDPSEPRGNHPSVHRGGYTPGYTVETRRYRRRRRRSLQPALRRSTLDVLPPSFPPSIPLLASVHRPLSRRPRLSALSFSLSVFSLPPPPPPRHCRRGCSSGNGSGSSSSGNGSGSSTARDTHYPPLTNHLDHRLRIAECLVRAAGIPASGISAGAAADGIGGQIGHLRQVRRAHLCSISRELW